MSKPLTFEHNLYTHIFPDICVSYGYITLVTGHSTTNYVQSCGMLHYDCPCFIILIYIFVGDIGLPLVTK